MALVVTPGAPNADAYVTAQEVEVFMDSVGGVGWDDLTTPQQEARIRGVTAFFDATLSGRFKGRKVTGRAQALEWPRSGVTDLHGDAVDPTTVPREVKRAIVFGVKMSMEGELDVSTSYLADGSIEDLRVGPLEIGFASHGSSVRGPDPTKVFEPYMRGLLRTRGVTGLVV